MRVTLLRPSTAEDRAVELGDCWAPPQGSIGSCSSTVTAVDAGVKLLCRVEASGDVGAAEFGCGPRS